MSDNDASVTPLPADDHVEALRDELNQQNIDKQGDQRGADAAGAMPSSHFGAVEDESSGHSDQVTIVPPMTGPVDVTDDTGVEGDEILDPQDEIQDAG
jgi:hypothetical protein